MQSTTLYQPKRLKAKRQLFPGCKFSMFCFKVFNKKSGVVKLKTENPVSSVQISKSLKCQICKILKKLRIKGTKNKDTGGEMNSGSERSRYQNINENRRGGSAHVLPYRAEPNPVGNNGQGATENYVTEKMIVGLIIMSHYFLMLNNYVGKLAVVSCCCDHDRTFLRPMNQKRYCYRIVTKRISLSMYRRSSVDKLTWPTCLFPRVEFEET
ncbi:hypothetical protein POM88_050953 [Heracleum sosnowskyi]|uniref:Uncharacterized protein n=1 Tax=Heracleum sosnowskyi TaxID=360622 RepID=A0AAD8GYN8_9APIA|nr:hypothetical protein POM88_050953 [Heracleum sosnowskyi]